MQEKGLSDLMGFCFHKCYNYRQDKSIIPSYYIQNGTLDSVIIDKRHFILLFSS